MAGEGLSSDAVSGEDADTGANNEAKYNSTTIFGAGRNALDGFGIDCFNEDYSAQNDASTELAW